MEMKGVGRTLYNLALIRCRQETNSRVKNPNNVFGILLCKVSQVTISDFFCFLLMTVNVGE